MFSPNFHAGDITIDKSGWWWFHYLGFKTPQWYKPNQILTCPDKRIDNPNLEDIVVWGNYGVNWSICRSSRSTTSLHSFIGTPLGSQNISRTAETALIIDSGYGFIGWLHATQSPPQKSYIDSRNYASYIPGLSINSSPKKYLLDYQHTDAIEGRHPNKTINVGYVDGHIDRIPAEETLVEQDVSTYTNTYPFWEPKK